MNGGAQFFSIQFSNASGTPYASAKLYHYASGGTTDKDIYSDEAKTTPLAQPFIADAAGRFSFYADGDYHFVVKDSAGNALAIPFDIDPIRCTKINAGIWTGDHGTAYPTATAASIGHTFGKTASAVLRGIGYNADGTNYDEILTWNAAGVPTFANIAPGLPIADITYYGALIDGTTDDSTAVQAAITALNALGGGILLSPKAGTCIVKNILLKQNITVVGTGFGSVFKLPAAGVVSGDWLFKGASSGADNNITFRDITLNGNNQGSGIYLVKLQKITAGNSNILFDNVQFTNHNGEAALYATVASGGTLAPFSVMNCVFYDLNGGVYGANIRPIIEGCSFIDINKAVTSRPIHLSTVVGADVTRNHFSTWGSTVAAIYLQNTTFSRVIGNYLPGAEAYSIQEYGTTDYNIVSLNDVSGTHANDITILGAHDIVSINMGTSIYQNGSVPGTSITITAYNYKLYENEVTTSEGTANGQLNDTSVQFSNVFSIDNPAGTHFDLVNFPSLAVYKDMYFPVGSVANINRLQLRNSDVFTSSVTIPTATPYDLYPNFGSAVYESDAFATLDLEATYGVDDIDTIANIINEKEFFKVEVYQNSGSASSNVDISYTWGDIVSYLQVGNGMDTNGTALLLNFWPRSLPGMNTLTIKASDAHVSDTSKVRVKLFRLKRAVDI